MENKLAEVVDKAVITEQNMEEILCSNENDVADDLNSLGDVATL
jgi:hypothetical protein